jgi:quinol monooxygenase YgiN
MLALVVNFTVRAGDEAKAKEYMRIMEEHTRREPGCRQYIGHQSQEEPRHFMFYELYENEAALEQHRASSHYERFVTNGLLKLMETRAPAIFQTID